MDYSKLGSSVFHYLLEFPQIHAHCMGMLSNHLILCCRLPPLPSIFPSQWNYYIVSILGHRFFSGLWNKAAPYSLIGLVGIVFPFLVAYSNTLDPMNYSVTGQVLQEAENEMELGMLKAYCERKREETRLGRWSHQTVMKIWQSSASLKIAHGRSWTSVALSSYWWSPLRIMWPGLESWGANTWRLLANHPPRFTEGGYDQLAHHLAATCRKYFLADQF